MLHVTPNICMVFLIYEHFMNWFGKSGAVTIETESRKGTLNGHSIARGDNTDKHKLQYSKQSGYDNNGSRPPIASFDLDSLSEDFEEPDLWDEFEPMEIVATEDTVIP
jgi:hypothetical protein